MRKQNGFTLIEIAIVLVIIGLLLGGVLKGQELITSARVRNLISQQDGIKAAYFGFLDRFRALPGDYNQAVANISGVGTACGTAGNGNGNGQIENAGGERIMVWDHLSKAGFINGSYTCVDAATLNTNTNPTNPYSMFLVMIYDDVYAGNATNRHNLKTGNQIPADILVEVDRKVDDGFADRGTFRFSAHTGLTTGTAPTAANCFTAATGAWIATGAIETNCGGTSLF
ncbi:MAG: prepilin-type N-terminal cleavage/methylation domain-containing protein [Burkholderiales bacterium]|nr:prepilin-type N-terminal cleavage/methylation domain-containing protein [Burkholderiales bacterium]